MSLIFLYLLNYPYLMMIRTFLKQTTTINGRKKHYENTYDTFSVYMQ